MSDDELESPGEIKELPPQVDVEIYKPNPKEWKKVTGGINRLEHATFDDQEGGAFSAKDLKEMFNLDNNVAVLMRDKVGEIIGYTLAVPLEYESHEDGIMEPFDRDDNGEKTAYVESTAIHPRYQKKGLARQLLGTLDKEVVAAGYTYLERDADVANGYNETLLKFYGDRIVATKEPQHTEYGMKQWMRIKLSQPGEQAELSADQLQP